jgi:hypothetical protein
MRAKRAIGVLSIVVLLATAVPLIAHHAFSAEYDQSKPLLLEGTFTKIDWVNPHSWVHFQVKYPDGKVVTWAAETPPPNGLYRNGWRKDTLKAGEVITVQGFAAKDGTPHMWASQVRQKSSGQQMFGMNARAPGSNQ